MPLLRRKSLDQGGCLSELRLKFPLYYGNLFVLVFCVRPSGSRIEWQEQTSGRTGLSPDTCLAPGPSPNLSGGCLVDRREIIRPSFNFKIVARIMRGKGGSGLETVKHV